MEEFDFHSLLIIETHLLSPVGVAPLGKRQIFSLVCHTYNAHILKCRYSKF